MRSRLSQRAEPDNKQRWLPRLLVTGCVGLLMLVALYPICDRILASRDADRMVAEARAAVLAAGAESRALSGTVCLGTSPQWLLRTKAPGPLLASWGNIGGCGVGGGASATGGVKWIGRGVTGGLVDLQCIESVNSYPDGGYQSILNTRLGTTLWYKWAVAANLPFRYGVQDLEVFGETRAAYLPGFGDLGLELTRKLGITNASSLTLSLGFPTGSYDAVRKGVILPQRMQLGTGALSGSLVFEHTRDEDWGLMVFGGSLSYAGWENGVGDRWGSSASAYAYAGYLLGPLVPSVGLTLTGKLSGDQERYVRVADQPMGLATVNLATEWSSDWLAVLLSAALPFSLSGLESWTVALGVQTSLF